MRCTAFCASQEPRTISRANAPTTTGVANDVPLHLAQPSNLSGSSVSTRGSGPSKLAKNDETRSAPGAQAFTQEP